MNLLHNKIAIKNRNAVIVTPSTGSVSNNVIAALNLELATIGYSLDGPVMDILKTFTSVELSKFRGTLISTLKEMIGGHVKFVPLFKNFPENIPDDAEYVLKRLLSVLTNDLGMVPEAVAPLSCGHVIDPRLFDMEQFNNCPICHHQDEDLAANRPSLDEITPLKLITLASEQDVYQIFKNLVGAKSSISESNTKLIEDLVIAEGDNITNYVPDEIVMKENLALLAGLLLKNTTKADVVLTKYFKTATDVLRLAVQLSDGDVSLATKTKFKLNNKARRVIMNLLNNIKVENAIEDMIRYRMEWVRLGEVLHIGSKKNKYPNAFQAIDIIRNKADDVETFNSRVENLIIELKTGNSAKQNELVSLLVTRPGEYARRLDLLVSLVDVDVALATFKEIIGKIQTPMLLTINAHFVSRLEKRDIRYFMPKGSIAKVQALETDREALSPTVVETVKKLIAAELIKRFSDLETLGNVYIDPVLKNIVLPVSQRSASDSLVTIPRGSRVNVPAEKTIRMFLYWKNIENSGWEGRVDVDLSAVAYSENWDYKFHLSYTNLSAVGGVHSGDITDAPDGAAEFIDIDRDKALSCGVRYVAMNVISFTGQSFNQFESFAGVMARENPGRGGYFEPTTVEHKFDVSGETRINVPLIYDLVDQQIIWGDIALNSAGRFDNVESNSGSIIMMGKYIEEMLSLKPNMFDLLDLHAKARATSIDYVFDPEKEYDTVIDMSMAVKLDDILANWL